MTVETKTRVCAGLAGVITAVMLADATGLAAVVGWALWALALVVVLSAVPPAKRRRNSRRRRAPSVLARW